MAEGELEVDAAAGDDQDQEEDPLEEENRPSTYTIRPKFEKK